VRKAGNGEELIVTVSRRAIWSISSLGKGTLILHHFQPFSHSVWILGCMVKTSSRFCVDYTKVNHQ
jgi:hypothetical protein